MTQHPPAQLHAEQLCVRLGGRRFGRVSLFGVFFGASITTGLVFFFPWGLRGQPPMLGSQF